MITTSKGRYSNYPGLFYLGILPSRLIQDLVNFQHIAGHHSKELDYYNTGVVCEMPDRRWYSRNPTRSNR